MTEDTNAIALTKQQEKLLLAREQTTDELQHELGFVCRMMATASMPHSKVSGHLYQRKTKNLTLSIVSAEEGCIPYGIYPRLILAWLISEVVKKQSKEIELGENMTQFMKNVGLSATGGKEGSIKRLKQQLRYLFSASISFQYEDQKQWRARNMHVTEDVHFFWEDDFHPKNKNGIFKQKIKIGDALFQEIMKAPIPIDVNAINALKDSSLALDIYFWLTYRFSYLGKTTAIPFEKLQLQFGAGYSNTKNGRNDFKRKFLIQLKKVLFLYPNANIKIDENGILLMPSKSHIKKLKP